MTKHRKDTAKALLFQQAVREWRRLQWWRRGIVACHREVERQKRRNRK